MQAPEGFVYVPEFLSEAEERSLIDALQSLEFGEIHMHGVVAKRHVAHYGWLYGYESWRLTPGPPIPDVLLPLRERAGQAVGVQTAQLAEALVTEYPPGAGIGWHRDAPMFGIVVAISLAGACRLRFQRGKGPGRETAEVALAPRSLYALTGSARSDWQHSIPAGKELRYSTTFRTLRNADHRTA